MPDNPDRMTKQLLLLACMISPTLDLLSQEIVTDRPDQTESSVTVPAQSLQFEVGFGIGSDDLANQYVTPTTLTRYGLLKSIELRLAEHLFGTKDKQTSEKEFGLSDLELGTKIQILRRENVNTEIAFISHIVIPTGSDAFSAGQVGTISKIAVSHGLSSTLDLGYNLGYMYFGEGKGDLTYSLVTGLDISEKLGTYIEVFGGIEEFENWILNLDGGFTYLFRQNLQVDLSAGMGLNHKMNYLSLGFSWNINMSGKNP
jgi:hypothetical protein